MTSAPTDGLIPPEGEEERDGGEVTIRNRLLELGKRVAWMVGAFIVGTCIFLAPPINFAIWDLLFEPARSLINAPSPAPDFSPLIIEPLKIFGAYYPVDMELLGFGAAEAFMVLVISLIVVGTGGFPQIRAAAGGLLTPREPPAGDGECD